uniref:EGF-like domain-containing protein n=1 Tax=Heterorhabditis bacteriophora TaxID=37862 RepID=A0A1I7W651_HETBA
MIILDINECKINSHNCNDVIEQCHNTVPGFFCNCTNGYERNEKGVCSPLKKCDTECKEYAECRYMRDGNSACICQTGYVVNAERVQCNSLIFCVILCCFTIKVSFMLSCVVPKCTPDTCDENAECRETSEGTTCMCKEGYRGVGTIVDRCQPINPCVDSPNMCSKYAKCECPSPGKHVCVCDPNYTGNGTWCTDIDECLTGLHNCDENANCINYQGGFSCKCKTGYSGSGIKGDCSGTNRTSTLYSDINECLSPKDNQCDPISTCCVNTVGSYHCRCNSGYTRSSDPHKCEESTDINECTQNSTLCGIHHCQNEKPFYKCRCLNGYESVDDSQRACKNIDECLKGTAICHPNALCTDTEGSYKCSCKTGYSGDGTVNCDLIDLCKTGQNECKPESTTCYMFPDKPVYRCDCKPGFEVPPGQTDVRECTDEKQMSPKKQLTCVNLDECAMDPAYDITIKKLSSGEYSEKDWTTVMEVPRNNDSGYAWCYYHAKAGGSFVLTVLPLCTDAPPNIRFPYNTNKPAQFSQPVGFGCGCLTTELTVDPYRINKPICNRQFKNFKNFHPVANVISLEVLFVNKTLAICSVTMHTSYIAYGLFLDFECDNQSDFPETIKDPQDRVYIHCINNVFHPAPGFELIRDNVTGCVLAVRDRLLIILDIDECARGDACCEDEKYCNDDNCVRCINTKGSFSCQLKDRICESSKIDRKTCQCKKKINKY